MTIGPSPADHNLGEGAARESVELLRPYPSEEMRAYRVRPTVDSPKNDTPECIEPAA